MNIVKGKKAKVQVLAYNKQGKKVKLTYKSSNPSVAVVNKSNGTITTKKNVTATITATGKCVKRATLTVKVVTKTINVNDISINNWRSTQEMYIGDSKTISAAPVPSNATNALIKYKSSSTDVARVTSSGTVTAVGTGAAEIIVSCDKYSSALRLNAGKRPTKIEQTVYSDHGVTIVASNMEFNRPGTSADKLWFTVTNDNEYRVRIDFSAVSVNGNNLSLSNGSWMYNRVENKCLEIPTYDRGGIKDINKVGVSIKIYHGYFNGTEVSYSTQPLMLNV